MIETLKTTALRFAAIVRGTSLRTRIVVGAGLGVVVAVAITRALGSGPACNDRAAVEARVASLSALLQESATQGRINTQELAARIKRLNAAATDFETGKDLAAYCEALDGLGAEFDTAS